MIYIGVDPGTTGAIAFISDSSYILVVDFTIVGLEKLRYCAARNVIGGCFIEAVHSMPKQGVSTTFKFGTAYGRVMGWLDALQIPYELVTPQKWQKAMYDSAPRHADKKARSLELARRLFPGAVNELSRKKDHNRADALLIAEYCRRVKTQKGQNP